MGADYDESEKVIKAFHMNASNRPHLIQQVERLDCTSTIWVVDVRPKKSKRTLDQNSRLWKLYTEFGRYLGLESDEVHQLMGYRFLRYQKEVGGKVEEFITSTTKLNTKQMGEYQDSIERYAAQLGFVFEEMECP